MSGKKTPWNPSKTATARVKNPLSAPKICKCGGEVKIAGHKEVYGRDYSDWPWMYRCDKCDSYVGMHPFTNIPLGTLADKETRTARNECKQSFNEIWQDGHMSRSDAYKWLAKKMGIKQEECHFGWFDADTCYTAANHCLDFLLEKSK